MSCRAHPPQEQLGTAQKHLRENRDLLKVVCSVASDPELYKLFLSQFNASAPADVCPVQRGAPSAPGRAGPGRASTFAAAVGTVAL